MLTSVLLACLGWLPGALDHPADQVPAAELFRRLAEVEPDDERSRLEVIAVLAERPHAEIAAAARALLSAPRHAVQRQVALDLLRPAAVAGEVELGFRLATEGANGLEDHVATSFGVFVATLHARDRSATGHVVRCALERDVEIQGIVVDALLEYRHTRTAEALERLMDHSADLRRALIVPLARLWVELPSEPPAQVLRNLRGALDDADAGVRREGALAMGWLRDGNAASTLVTMLEKEDRAIANAAHWALGRISGLPLRADARVWRTWLDQSERWWMERAQECFATLRHGSPQEVLAALQEIGRQRLHRERVARELEATLLMDSPEVVATTAAILAQLRVPSSVPSLVRVLLRPDPRMRSAAHEALRALTGEDLPPDHADWRAWLQAR